MLDKNDWCIILLSLESYKIRTMIPCIYCDLVEYREDYAKKKYCVENCGAGKQIGIIDSLISKIKGQIE